MAVWLEVLLQLSTMKCCFVQVTLPCGLVIPASGCG